METTSREDGNDVLPNPVEEEYVGPQQEDDTSTRMVAPLGTVSSPRRSLSSSFEPPATTTTTRGSLEQALCFACGLGTSIGYIATLSSLVYFKMLHGANSFVYLNLAVYLPLLPISLAQARWDQYYDVQFTSRMTFLVRGIVGFLLNVLGTHGMMLWHDKGLLPVILFALLQGTGGAILYGTLNQMASFVMTTTRSDDDRQLKTAVSAGVQASALLVLVVSLWTGFGVHQASKFPTFLGAIVGIELLCFVLFLWLLRARPPVEAAMIRRDSSLRLLDEAEGSDRNNLLPDPDGEISFPTLDEPLLQPQPSASESTFQELWYQTRGCCWILGVTLVPSFLVGSWFTRVQTDWMALASYLFYIRIGSDFCGRLATIWIPPRAVSCLGQICAVRLVFVALFFANSHRSILEGPAADALSILLVALIAFLSGYLVTGAFQLAPHCLETEKQSKNVAKQASLLTVAFAVSAIVGLVSSFGFLALGV